MLKAPVAGRVKTRLGREIGMVEAAWWFRHQMARTLRALQDPRWETLLAVSPDGARLKQARGLPVIGQGRGDLGRRMARLLRALPPGPRLVVGADIPGLGREHIWRAFRALGGHEAVFGPAEDGGFWLVGLGGVRPPPPGFFRDVRWSSRHALADSMASLPGWRIALADRLRDVDGAADLKGWAGTYQAGVTCRTDSQQPFGQ